MAIYHLHMAPISRSSGRSAVAAAAYRTAEKILNERDGELHDFTRRSGVAGSEMVLPSGVSADWALDRSALWNAAEKSEKRKDSRVAREFEVSLPHELDAEQRQALARAFAQHLADQYGAAVDMAIHEPHGHTDERNHHAHLMMTTRQLVPDTPNALGDKTHFEREGKWLMAQGLPVEREQLKAARVVWEEIANRHLVEAGLDVRIDHRSHEDRGLSIEPTRHMGVHASQMQRRGLSVERTALDVETAKRNAEKIRENPEEVLTILTGEKSVFDRHDIARCLHRYLDDPEEYPLALAAVMGSQALVALVPERKDEDTGELQLAKYSTREMVEVERAMVASAVSMAGDSGKPVPAAAVREVVADRADGVSLSAEQQVAVEHVAGSGRMAAVVGLAGAGKSTMLGVAREAWEARGLTVHGAALSGKAAEGLEASSGIASRTLASWEMGWKKGFDELGAGDVFVIDEAGMVSSRQLARFVEHADKAGAKLVLVGDPEQLQPINAGAAFRAIAERVGFVSLEAVRRQRSGWMREASVAFGRYQTGEGLAAYEQRGQVVGHADGDGVRAAMVNAVMADRQANPRDTRIVLAHRRVDVRMLNEDIRDALKGQGALAAERDYSTNDGKRSFAAGDRLVFLQNDRGLRVKNGTLGTVTQVGEGQLSVRTDAGAEVTVSAEAYPAFDHGYATTIHKSQGATVDRAFVMASKSMDRHLAYVAMTRHRVQATLHYSQGEFRTFEALTDRLSRSNAKETTLDYASPGQVDRVATPAERQALDAAAFGERRGLDVGDGWLATMARVEQRIAEWIEQRRVQLGLHLSGRQVNPEPGAGADRSLDDALAARASRTFAQFDGRQQAGERAQADQQAQRRALIERQVAGHAGQTLDRFEQKMAAKQQALAVAEREALQQQKKEQEAEKVRDRAREHSRGRGFSR